MHIPAIHVPMLHPTQRLLLALPYVSLSLPKLTLSLSSRRSVTASNARLLRTNRDLTYGSAAYQTGNRQQVCINPGGYTGSSINHGAA